MISVGVVGIGFGQHVHVPAFRSDPRFRVTAICASTKARACAAATRLGVEKAFGGWREMLEDGSLDGVSIATPPLMQPEIATAALGRGKAVFCEKPLATSIEAAYAMTAAAESAGLANIVDFEFPEVMEWKRAKAIIQSGGIGRLRHVAVNWNVETYSNVQKLDSWKASLDQGGGTLSSFVSHTFYYLEWIAGPITDVSARLFRMPDDTRSGDALATLVVQFKSGAAGTISVSAAAFPGSGHKLEFYGEDGAVWLENTTRDYMRGFRLLYGTRNSGRMEPVCETAPVGIADGRVEAVSQLVSRFADWIETGTSSGPCFRDGFRVQQLIHSARISSESGGCAQPVPNLYYA